MEEIKRLTEGCEKNHGFSLSISRERERVIKREKHIFD